MRWVAGRRRKPREGAASTHCGAAVLTFGGRRQVLLRGRGSQVVGSGAQGMGAGVKREGKGRPGKGEGVGKINFQLLIWEICAVEDNIELYALHAAIRITRQAQVCQLQGRSQRGSRRAR